METAATDQRVRVLASRRIFNIGSYLGVPVTLADGRLYGTLCVLDPSPHQFNPDDLDLLVILSRWLRFYLERSPLDEEVTDATNST